MSIQPTSAQMPIEQRRWLLEHEVGRSVSQGASVAYRTADLAVLSYGSPVNHGIHLIAILLTCGLWFPVWILVGMTGGVQMVNVWVDEWGTVQRVNGAQVA